MTIKQTQCVRVELPVGLFQANISVKFSKINNLAIVKRLGFNSSIIADQVEDVFLEKDKVQFSVEVFTGNNTIHDVSINTNCAVINGIIKLSEYKDFVIESNDLVVKSENYIEFRAAINSDRTLCNSISQLYFTFYAIVDV